MMLNTANLSLDQAPPISIPLRFFVTAPLFGIAAGVLSLLHGEGVFESRWLPATLAITHLLTLGFLVMVMLGALLQMLPVMAGSPVPRVVLVGGSTHLLVSLGAILTVAAVIVLALGLALFMLAAAIALFRVNQPGVTVIGMRLAVTALLVTLVTGGVGAMLYVGYLPAHLVQLSLLTDVHLGWGLLGWVGLLLMSVSFQLIPMFMVTPEYPGWLTRKVPWWIFFGLSGWLALKLFSGTGDSVRIAAAVLLLGCITALAGFALVTLQLQRQRKRRIPDVALLFWRTGMTAAVGCALLWVAGLLSPELARSPGYQLVLGIGLVLGVGFSVVNGMLYKIVPFLSWFHLQNRQLALMCMTVTVPHMKEFVTDRAARRQYYSYLSALVLLLAAAWKPAWFARPAAALFILCNLLLLVNLAGAVGRFRATAKMLQAESTLPRR